MLKQIWKNCLHGVDPLVGVERPILETRTNLLSRDETQDETKKNTPRP